MRKRHRLLRSLRQEGECWLWTGAITPHGYGVFSIGPKSAPRSIVAHRVAYEVLVGPIPDGAVLDHVCGNRACCRPEHLEPVTHAVNTQRKRTAKLSWEKVRAIRRRAADGEATRVLAEEYGVTPECIRGVVRNKTWVEVSNPPPG